MKCITEDAGNILTAEIAGAGKDAGKGDKMKFKIMFTKDLSDIMEQVLQNEKTAFEKRSKGAMMSIVNRAWNKSQGYSLAMKFDYELISNTEAIIDIQTGIDELIKPKAMLKKLQKKYEDVSNGKIKIRMVKNE